MTRIKGTSKRLLNLLVVIVLLFAIGASGQRFEDELQNSDKSIDSKLSIQNQDNNQNQETAQSEQEAKLSANAMGENTVDAAEIVETLVPDSVKNAAIAWAYSNRDEIEYTADQVVKAYQVYEETPLSFESALSLSHYCEVYSVETALVLSIIEVESRFNQHAVGSSKDRGYMQIIPSTEKWLARSYGEELGLVYNPQSIFDPKYNLGLAIRYISDLENKYGNNDHRVLSEYNRGSVKLATYYKTHQTYQTSYSRSILNRKDKYEFEEPNN